MKANHWAIRKPADFDAYWEGVRKTVDQYNPELNVEKWEQEDVNYEGEYIIGDTSNNKLRPQEGVNPFEFRWGRHTLLVGLQVKKILFKSHDGQEVGGLLQYPRRSCKEKFPVIVHFTGYGGELMVDPDLVASGYAVFNFSHRGMVLGSKGLDRYSPVPLLVRGIEDKDKYIYRSSVIDCLLAIRILKKMEQIDTDRIGVMGTSQGGALSLMTASLDDMARVVSCDIPWLTNFEYQLNHDVEGPYNEIKEFIRRFPEKSSSVVNTLGYFDSLFFADTVKRPVLVSLGQSDKICPPDSVRDLFGRLPSIKALLEIPGMAHERSTVWRYMSQKWFDFYL